MKKVRFIYNYQTFRKLKVKLKSKEVNYEGDMYLVLVFNGQTAGGFKLATKADVTDGFFRCNINKSYCY